MHYFLRYIENVVGNRDSDPSIIPTAEEKFDRKRYKHPNNSHFKKNLSETTIWIPFLGWDSAAQKKRRIDINGSQPNQIILCFSRGLPDTFLLEAQKVLNYVRVNQNEINSTFNTQMNEKSSWKLRLDLLEIDPDKLSPVLKSQLVETVEIESPLVVINPLNNAKAMASSLMVKIR